MPILLFALNNWRWLLMAALGVVISVQTARLEWCQRGRAADEAKITVLGSQIAEQNRAVEALQAKSAAKALKSAQALRAAEGRAQVWDAQAKRLTAILTSRKPGEAKACSDAWREISTS